MDDFKKIILQTKKISIWGIGYLGYTSTLRLFENGFSVSLYDFNETRLNDIKNGNYPAKEQLNSWSKNGKVPFLDLEKIDIVKDKNLLFKNQIHIISFPNTDNFDYVALAELFVINKDELKDSLVIFQSAGIPRAIEDGFSKILKENNVEIEIATVFRSDWIIEDFFSKDSQRTISANSSQAIEKTKTFLKLLSLEAIELQSIEESELYENTKNALNYTMVAFFNQLSLAYPHINVNQLSQNLLKDMNFNNLSLGVSAVDYKSEQSVENVLRGSSGEYLSILKEANNTNISFLFYYVNLLKNKNIDSVTILGLSSYNSMKDLRFSPSVMLAEYLHKENIKVYIHDDNFNQEELLKVLPCCEFIDIDSKQIETDTVLIMSLSNKYRFFTQNKVDKMGLSKVKYILDNTGFFKDFTYSNGTLYHQLCDGKLIEVVN